MRSKKVSRVALDTNKAYIIAANHSGAIDPFIITANLPWHYILTLTPYRFMTANKFFSRTLLLPFLFALGCYPANKHPRFKSGLEYTQKLIEKRYCIVIFPEGKVSRIDRQYPARKGIEVLVQDSGVEILPVRVKWNRRKGLLRSYSLTVGKPFSGKNMTAEQIMDVVYGLKFR